MNKKQLRKEINDEFLKLDFEFHRITNELNRLSIERDKVIKILQQIQKKFIETRID